MELGELAPGKVMMKEVKGRRLYFLKPDAEQKQAIIMMRKHAWDNSISNYEPIIEAYVYWSMSTKWGCDLDFMPPQESHLKQWNRNAVWLGGYWDQWCEVSYDYAGRTIKPTLYTFKGYIGKFPNLQRPQLKRGSYGKIIVSMFQS